MNIDNRKWLIQHTLLGFSITVPALLISFFYLDVPVANFFNRSELEKIYYYSREITNIGYSIHYFLIAMAGFIFSRWIYPKSDYFKQKINPAQNYKINQWSVFAIRSLLLIGILLNILKSIIGRQRPHLSSEFHNLNFDTFTLHHHWHSLPSGHAQVVFTVATVALLIWPKHKYLFLFLAGLFALTRIAIHQHFLSDIIAGGFIGYIATLWLYNLWPPKHLQKQ